MREIKFMKKQTALWTMKDGTNIRICDMEDSHLTNSIKMLERATKSYEVRAIKYGYQMLAGLQGEIALDSVERDISILEDGLDPGDLFPIYLKLCIEFYRRFGKEPNDKP